jgi:hypothetical protein
MYFYIATSTVDVKKPPNQNPQLPLLSLPSKNQKDVFSTLMKQTIKSTPNKNVWTNKSTSITTSSYIPSSNSASLFQTPTTHNNNSSHVIDDLVIPSTINMSALQPNNPEGLLGSVPSTYNQSRNNQGIMKQGLLQQKGQKATYSSIGVSLPLQTPPSIGLMPNKAPKLPSSPVYTSSSGMVESNNHDAAPLLSLTSSSGSEKDEKAGNTQSEAGNTSTQTSDSQPRQTYSQVTKVNNPILSSPRKSWS